MTENLTPFNPAIRDSSNRHIVDRLAELRDKIAYLKGIESSLKDAIAEMMGEGSSLGGDEYIAIKVVSERAGSIDVKLMSQEGIDVEKYRKPKSTSVSIRLEERRVED